jgi:ketosteroid isomerase-like protein
MKKLFVLYLFVFQLVSSHTFAQAPSKIDWLKELNRDIWLPFMEAYASGNVEKYLALHSKDFIRGMGDQNLVNDLKGYGENSRKMFKNLQESGAKVKIDFRFLKRIANAQSAYEIGIYQFTALNSKGEAQNYYGKFHVVSRKENNVWKILVDYDSNENETINEAVFKQGFAADDFSKFQ